MRRRGIIAMMAALLFMFSSGVVLVIVQAKEKKAQIVRPSEVRPYDSTLKGLGKKGGGGTPDPPADPHCTHGSVGPITHETVKKSCRVDGKDGTKTCYIKSVACLSGPGEDEYAQTENCGSCFVLPNRDPGQVETPTGR